MSGDALFNASICEGVAAGTCIHIQDGEVVYAGPINCSPPVGGKLVLLNASDFEKLKAVVDKHKH